MREENNIRKNHYYKIGTAYEEQAVLFLEKEGYEILERNFHSYHGEIDIIAREDEYLVFVEVKYRRAAYPGAALAAVTPAKQKRIRQTAEYYLYSRHYSGMDIPCRFDVVAFEGEKFTHLKNAFM